MTGKYSAKLITEEQFLEQQHNNFLNFNNNSYFGWICTLYELFQIIVHIVIHVIQVRLDEHSCAFLT